MNKLFKGWCQYCLSELFVFTTGLFSIAILIVFMIRFGIKFSWMTGYLIFFGVLFQRYILNNTEIGKELKKQLTNSERGK